MKKIDIKDIDNHYPGLTAQRNAQVVYEPVAIGDTVVYVNPVGLKHNAIVTAVWGSFIDHVAYTQEDVDDMLAKQKANYSQPGWEKYEWNEEENRVYYSNLIGKPIPIPCINLVFVEKDENKTDSYGRQIARNTSVQHQSMTQAHGMYWHNV